jgi:hypothetical protein
MGTHLWIDVCFSVRPSDTLGTSVVGVRHMTVITSSVYDVRRISVIETLNTPVALGVR